MIDDDVKLTNVGVPVLKRFDQKVFDEWVSTVDEICSYNLSQPLITRNPDTLYIATNFSPQVCAPVLF